jgi:hypothetical protein
MGKVGHHSTAVIVSSTPATAASSMQSVLMQNEQREPMARTPFAGL